MRLDGFGRCVMCAIIAFCSLISPMGAAAVESVVINEACGSNRTIIKDEYGQYPDYIELYNATDADIDLSGYMLSDSAASFVLPDSPLCVVPRRGYRVIFFSGAAGGEVDLHVPLKLSAGAPETISLYAPNGDLIDSMDMPAMDSDEAFSRQEDGQYAKTGGTPLAQNEVGTPYVSKPLVLTPMLSHASGFYDEPFMLDIQGPKGCAVYYTLDSSDPTMDDAPFTEPIRVTDPSSKPNVYSAAANITTEEYTPPAQPVDKAFVVRAVAVDKNGNASKPATGVYFIGFQNKPLYKDMGFVSLVTDPDNLFDDETGIYVLGSQYEQWFNSDEYDKTMRPSHMPANYNQSGRAWEREAEMTYFNDKKNLLLTQSVGIRIRGNYTRAYPNKSFNIYARKSYGSGTFKYEFFDGAKGLDTIALRNGASDGRTMMRDPLGQSLVSGLGLATQRYIPCVLFLDGEYWGFYFIRERLSEAFIAERFGVDADSVEIIKDSGLKAGPPSVLDDFKRLERFASSNDLTIDSNYEIVGKQLDIDNYIKYICAEMFMANDDWAPNNTAYWRTKSSTPSPYDDGKWRCVMIDMDITFDLYAQGYESNSFERAKAMPLFKALIRNKDFYERLLLQLSDISNFYFDSKKVASETSTLWNLIKENVIYSHRRFSRNLSMEMYNDSVNRILWLTKDRMNYLSNYIAPDRPLITLTIEENLPGAANCHLNTINPELVKGSWTGRYFTGSVMDVSVEPREGYLFDYWEVNGQEFTSQQRLLYPLDEPATLRAVFTAQDKLCRWEDSTDAVLKGFFETARMEPVGSASVKALGDGVFSLTSDGGWALSDGIDMTLCTAGCDRITFSAKLSGDRRAPRDYALYYSTDGANYNRVEGDIRVSDEDDTATYVSIALPDECSDKYELNVRLVVESEYCVNGKQTLIGETRGEGVLSDVAFRACASEMTYAYYDEAVERCERLANEYPAVAQALKDATLSDSLTQYELDEKTRALLNKAGSAMLGAGVVTLEEFSRRYDVSDQLYVDMCASAPVYTVTSDIVDFSQDKVIEMPSYYPNDSYLYRYEDGIFAFDGIMKARENDLVYFPMREGAYLWLESPIEKYQYSIELTVGAEDLDLHLSELGGSVPSDAAWFTLNAVEAFDGHCVVPFANWFGGRDVYAYEISNGEVTSSYLWEYFEGELITQQAHTGDYLLLADSIDDYARQAQELEAMREKMAAREKEEKNESNKELIVLVGVVLGALAAIVIVIVFMVKAFKKKNKKRRDD